MWPAWTSTATPSGTGHPATRNVLSEPSGLMENSRPPPLASSTNNFPEILVMISSPSRSISKRVNIFGELRRDARVARHQCVTCNTEGYGDHRRQPIHHAHHRSLLTTQRVSFVRRGG